MFPSCCFEPIWKIIKVLQIESWRGVLLFFLVGTEIATENMPRLCLEETSFHYPFSGHQLPSTCSSNRFSTPCFDLVSAINVILVLSFLEKTATGKMSFVFFSLQIHGSMDLCSRSQGKLFPRPLSMDIELQVPLFSPFWGFLSFALPTWISIYKTIYIYTVIDYFYIYTYIHK